MQIIVYGPLENLVLVICIKTADLVMLVYSLFVM